MNTKKEMPNKIKAKLIVEVEADFYDNESSEETLRYCVEQDLEDAGFNVIDVSVMKWRFHHSLWTIYSTINQITYYIVFRGGVKYEKWI